MSAMAAELRVECVAGYFFSRQPFPRLRRTSVHPPPRPTVDPPSAEAELLARLRAGEEAAFEQLVREHTPVLLRLARRLLRAEDEARDAVQDVFVSVFRGLPRFRAESRLGTWVYRIGLNACLSRLRARDAAAEETSLDDLLPRFLADGHAVVPSLRWPDAGAERRETREEVRRCIDRLPESYRTVILLRDIEELTTEEAAEALGVSPGALKVRLHRARQALRALLDPWMREERP
ncbi:MAG TPA: sigma-70 family RNA polymerase sigma factor [Longimicrobiaceae bacterium]|nr:sigma-70 family RNA polymerase sigma factor [Longimicrobiaceae bacterium]